MSDKLCSALLLLLLPLKISNKELTRNGSLPPFLLAPGLLLLLPSLNGGHGKSFQSQRHQFSAQAIKEGGKTDGQ